MGGGAVVDRLARHALGHQLDPALGDPLEVDRGGNAGRVGAVVPDGDVGAEGPLPQLHAGPALLDRESGEGHEREVFEDLGQRVLAQHDRVFPRPDVVGVDARAVRSAASSPTASGSSSR